MKNFLLLYEMVRITGNKFYLKSPSSQAISRHTESWIAPQWSKRQFTRAVSDLQHAHGWLAISSENAEPLYHWAQGSQGKHLRVPTRVCSERLSRGVGWLNTPNTRLFSPRREVGNSRVKERGASCLYPIASRIFFVEGTKDNFCKNNDALRKKKKTNKTHLFSCGAQPVWGSSCNLLWVTRWAHSHLRTAGLPSSWGLSSLRLL